MKDYFELQREKSDSKKLLLKRALSCYIDKYFVNCTIEFVKDKWSEIQEIARDNELSEDNIEELRSKIF
jgi:hypothetical protein